MFGKASDEWETPQDFFDALDEEFDFQIDAAATSMNAKCPSYFTVKENALERDWFNFTCGCLHALQSRQTGDDQVLRAEGREAERVGLVVPGLPSGARASEAGAPEDSRPREVTSREAAPPLQPWWSGVEACDRADREPQEARRELAVSMDARRLGSVSGVLEPPVRVLRTNARRAGSRCTTGESGLPWDRPVEHGPGLHEMQPLAERREGCLCPTCGIPGQPATVFVNPPYSRCRAFMAKAALEAQRGVTVVCLVPSRTDTRWFHSVVWDCDLHCLRSGVEVRFVKGRLKFGGTGKAENSAPFPSMVVIFRPVTP